MNNNIPRFTSPSYGSSSTTRIDANASVFFANMLTMYDPKIFETIKTPLTAFDIFKVKPIAPHDKIYTYNMYEGFGKSKYASAKNGKNNDMPYVSVNGQQFSSKIDDVYCAVAFSRADMAASQATQFDVITALQRQAWRSNYEAMNRTCFFGNKEVGLGGLLNNPFVKGANAESPVANNWSLSTTTAQMIYDDLLNSYNTILDSTRGNLMPNIALCSPATYNILSKKIFNTFNGLTLKEQFEGDNSITLKSCPELRQVFTGGKDGFVLLNNDSDYIEHIVSELFTILPPEAKGLEFESLCVSRHGGLVIRQPMSICIRRMV
jgi:hypothetical protein